MQTEVQGLSTFGCISFTFPLCYSLPRIAGTAWEQFGGDGV